MTLIDTCAIIYALDEKSAFHEWAVQAIINANLDGAFVNPVMVAELCSGSDNPELIPAELQRFGIQLADLPMTSAVRAGKAHAEYCKRLSATGKQGSKTPLPDFFIGAHAETTGCKIVTNDPSRFKTYFPKVRLITP